MAGIETLQRQFVREYPKLGDADPKREPELISLQEKLVSGARSLLLTLSLAVGVLLLIACANVTGILLARAVERQKSIAITIALGATPARVVMQLLYESILLTTAGGIVGFSAYIASIRTATGFISGILPGLTPASSVFDWRLASFAVAVLSAAAILCGLLPALQFANPKSIEILRVSRGATLGSRLARLGRNYLVIAQTALSVFLLVCAGLIVQTFVKALIQPVGFEPAGVLAMTVSLPHTRYSTPQQIVGFYKRTLPRIQSVPGVQLVAISSALPANESMLAHVLAEGEPNVPLARRDSQPFSR